MRYWDSSALLPLFVQEEETERCKTHLGADPQIVTWWGSRVECASAFNRLLREGIIEQTDFQQIQSKLDDLVSSWIETQPTEKLRRRALRLLHVHPLRAADSLQLAAALIACDENPHTLSFVCNDLRLRDAARQEGFHVLP